MINDDHRHTGLDSQQISYDDLKDKPSSSGAWTSVSHASVVGAPSFTISGLTGDTDKVYKLIFVAVFSSSEPLLHMRMNADTGSNYHYSIARHGLLANADNFSQSSSGALANNKEAYALLYDGSYKEIFADLTIYATSGFMRKSIGKMGCYLDGDNWMEQSPLSVWSNNSDELTSIKITAGQNFATGSEYWLYKL